MRTRRIGQLEVSVVGLGCNNFGGRIDADATRGVVDAALDAGITFFDTADVYGGDGRSEELLGAALGDRRPDAIIATKFGMELDEDRRGAHPDYLRRACADSLRRLSTDVIDLYQLHGPDPHVPIAETLGALHELVERGDVREIGCSNFTADQLDQAAAASADGDLARFGSVQNRYSVLRRDPEEDGVLEACERHDLAFIPFFPLEAGLLTGKYTSGSSGARFTGEGRLAQMPDDRRERFADDSAIAATQRLEAFAGEHGRGLLDVAFAYLLAQPRVASVIAGATRPDQVRANAASAEWQLDDGQLAAIRRLVRSSLDGPPAAGG